MTVEIRKMPTDAAKIRMPINRAQQMILRIMIIEQVLREQTRLRFLRQPHHHAQSPSSICTLQLAKDTSISKFSSAEMGEQYEVADSIACRPDVLPYGLSIC